MSASSSTTPLPRILAEFVEILPDDEDFPAAHTAWDRLADAPVAELVHEDYIAKFLEVRPAGFQCLLGEIGGSPSMNGLAAYVALLATYKR